LRQAVVQAQTATYRGMMHDGMKKKAAVLDDRAEIRE
jgi:hypothetical protein